MQKILDKILPEKSMLRNSKTVIVLLVLLIILSITSLFFAFYYNIYVEARQKETVNIEQSELDTSVSYFDTLIDIVRSMSNTILLDHDVLSIQEAPNDYGLYHSIISKLLEYKSSLSVINSIWTIYEEEDIILTSNEGYYKQKEFYDDIWKKFDECTKINKTTAISAPHILKSPVLDDIEVISTIRKHNILGHVHYVVINLDFKKVLEELHISEWNSSSSESELSVVDSDYKVLYDSNGLINKTGIDRIRTGIEEGGAYDILQTGGQKYIMVHKESEIPFIFIRLTSTDTSYVPQTLLQGVIRTCAFLCALSLILFIVFLARYVSAISKNEDRIRHSIIEHALIHRTADSEIDDYKSIVIDNYYILLIECMLKDDVTEEINSFFRIKQLRSGKAIKAEVIKLPVSYAIIISSERHISQEEIMETAGRLHKYLSNRYDDTFNISISAEHSGAESLHSAYTEVREVSYVFYYYPGKNIYQYESIKDAQKVYFRQNHAKDEMFANNIHNFKFDKAGEVFASIAADIEKALSGDIPVNLQSYLMSLFTQVRMAAERLRINTDIMFKDIPYRVNDYTMAWEFDNVNKSIEAMTGMLRSLDKHIKESDAEPFVNDRDYYISKTVEYIESRYSEGISLSEIADKLKIDESYLSRQFKEKMGRSFVQYVTKYRLTKAKELLIETDYVLDDIADRTGFGNSQNFIRIFKKYEGITPGIYRKRMLREE